MNFINKKYMNKLSIYYLCSDDDIININLLEININKFQVDNDDIMYSRLTKYLEIYNNMIEDNLDLCEYSKYLKKYKTIVRNKIIYP